MDRIEQLHKLWQEDANDPFVAYGLALEYQKENTEQALEWFRLCLSNFPDYLPAYYHAADLMAELELETEAKQTYQKGIALAKAQDNQKTLAELQNALMNWEIEWDM